MPHFQLNANHKDQVGDQLHLVGNYLISFHVLFHVHTVDINAYTVDMNLSLQLMIGPKIRWYKDVGTGVICKTGFHYLWL